MTDSDMMICHEMHIPVRTTLHDYSFEGQIVTIFPKLRKDYAEPVKMRCVVRDDRGLLLIQSAKNLEPVTPV